MCSRAPSSRVAHVVRCCALGIAMSAAACAQNASRATGLAASVQAVHRAATNLRVLPPDISAADLDALMKQYDRGLGVSCGFCHVTDPTSHRIDYASDHNAHKQTARFMIAMLHEINTRYLSKVGDPRYPVLITCGNCHQGERHPPDFEQTQ